MWLSHCGKPVSECDGSDSDCGGSSVGILPVLENVFMEDVMVISITHHLSRPSGSAQAPQVPTPDPSFFVVCTKSHHISLLLLIVLLNSRGVFGSANNAFSAEGFAL